VRRFGQEFMDTYVAVNNRPSERLNKRTMLNAHIVPLLGNVPLDRVGVRDLEALKARMLTEGLAPKTANNTLAMLGKMLRYAVEVGVIKSAPHARLLRVSQQPFDFLNFEECERLLSAIREDPNSYTAILFAVDTGARMGESLAITWDDIDLKAGTVRIARSDWMGNVTGTKTGKVRTIPMTKRLRAALTAYRHLRGQRVFCRADGTPWTKEVLRWMLPHACLRAGIRTIKWHALRHTFASRLAMTGAHPREIQELGGWSTLAMVERYTHMTPSRLRGAVERLEEPQADGNAKERSS
jgi:integrase